LDAAIERGFSPVADPKKYVKSWFFLARVLHGNIF
jgi:hypothetical protein